MKLIDERTLDGSRRFACLSRHTEWKNLRDHLSLLSGAEMLGYFGEEPIRRRLVFSFRGLRFLVCESNGCLQLSVDDPLCSDVILYEVVCHFETLLSKAM